MDNLSNFIDEIKNRVKISDVIARKVKLIPAGSDRYKGLCPFHQEKTPSFTVSNQKGIYHCFGCHKNGDVISFVQETTGVSFMEALEKLGHEVGLKLPENRNKADLAKKSEFEELEEIMQKALDYYQEQLELEQNSNAKNYFFKRGINSELTKKYKLGFAPKGNNIVKLLKNCSQEQLLKCGLVRKNERNEIYDLLQNRIIFPIFNHKHKVIAFGGRVLDQKLPKYINSPETIFFKKHSTLYNLNIAKEAAYKNQAIFVTEGYMDVLALAKYGIVNAVAPLGTAFSEKHLFLLWDAVKVPTICLDGDIAGLNAVKRIIDIALPNLQAGYSLNFKILPDKMDPDDYINSYGKDKFLELKNFNLADLLIDFTSEKIGLNSPENKALIEETLKQKIKLIKADNVRKQYESYVRNQLWQKFNPHSKKSKKQALKTNISLPKINNNSELVAAEKELIYFFIKFPQALDNDMISEEFCNFEFSDQESYNLQSFLLSSPSRDSHDLCLKMNNKKLIHSDLMRMRVANISNNSQSLAENKIETLWKYAQKLYFLAKMRKEFRDFLNSSDPEQNEKALELLKDIQELEKNIANHNNDFNF